jgi:hypothetical protein
MGLRWTSLPPGEGCGDHVSLPRAVAYAFYASDGGGTATT